MNSKALFNRKEIEGIKNKHDFSNEVIAETTSSATAAAGGVLAAALLFALTSDHKQS